MGLTTKLVPLGVFTGAAAAAVALAPVAHADYGGGAANDTWQIEVSINCNNKAACADIQGGTGGVWIWGELDTDGTNYTGDAQITYCFHGDGFSGAGHTSEDVSSWMIGENGDFVITGGTDTDLFRGQRDVHPIIGDDEVNPASPDNPSDTGVPAMAGTYHLGTADVFGQQMPPGVSAQITVAYNPAK